MSARKLPSDAFDLYVGLGAKRSYQAVADHYNVTKRAVTRRANREGWQARLEKIEAAATEKAEVALVEDYATVTERHLRMLRAIQHRSLMALQRLPLSTAMQAVRSLDLSIRAEQAILRPTNAREPNQLTLEELVTRSFQRGHSAEDFIDVEPATDEEAP